MIEFRGLGNIDLRVRGGVELRSVLSQPKRTALLAYLLLARPLGSHRRDQLVALFWPDADTAHARNSLSQAVHFLRRSLGEGVIESRGEEELSVREGALWCDVAEFDAALERGDAERALSLYGGELLPGLFVGSSPSFEHWLDAERARLAARAVRASTGLSEARERAGDLAGAVALGTRALALAPDDQALLMRQLGLLERSGDRAGAIACFEAYARRLLEYEVEPDAEARALAEAIRVRHTMAAAASPPVAESGVGAADVLGATSPPHRPAAVSGSPGVDGTRTPGRMPRWKGRGWAALLSGAALLALLATAAWLARSPAPIAVEGTEAIIAQTVNRTADTTLALTVTEALRTGLELGTTVRVLGAEEVRRILEYMRVNPDTAVSPALAQQVALRAGAELVIEPALGSAGNGYILTAQLVDPRDRRTLASVQATARGPDRLLNAIDELSRQVRRQLGESLARIRISPTLAQASTPSLEAWQKYARAVSGEMADFEESEALLREAIAIDPDFGSAYRALGAREYWTRRQLQDAAFNLAKAYQLRDRMTDRERAHTIAVYHRLVTGDRTRAIAGFNAILAQAGGNDSLGFAALDNLGNLHYDAHDYARAAEYSGRRAALVRSLPPGRHTSPPHMQLARALAALGQYGGVLAVARTLDLLKAEGADELRFNVAYDRRGARGADSLVRAWAVADSARVPKLARAHLALVQGRVRETARLCDCDPASLVHANLRGKPRTARRYVDSLVSRRRSGKLSAFDMPYDELVTVLSRTGDTRAARSLLLDYDTAVPPGMRQMAIATPYIERSRAELAIADGRFAEAIRHYQLADSIAPCIGCMLPGLGRAYEAAGQPGLAAAAYEHYLARSELHQLENDSEFLAFVLERLASLRERRGDAAGAAACYARFVNLWEHADAELQPRVHLARARLATLVHEGRVPLQPWRCGGVP